MAYLSVPAQSPLKRSFSETPYLRPATPLSNESVNTVRRCKPSNVSATSLISLTSIHPGPWLKTNENAPPKLSSRSLLDLIGELSASALTLKHPDDYFPEQMTWVSNIPLPPSPSIREVPKETTDSIHVTESDDAVSSPASTFQESASTIQDDTISETDSISWPIEVPEGLGAYGIAFDMPCPEQPLEKEMSSDESIHDDTSALDSNVKTAPFRRWVSTLRRRNKRREKNPLERWTIDGSETEHQKQRMDGSPRQDGHKKSSSLTSSLAFVTAVKSASITLAGTSIAPLTRLGTKRSRTSHAHRGSTLSDTRIPGDSVHPSITPIMDERVLERARHRRRIVEEIIASEEGYIGDLKVLVNVYFSVLESAPSVSSQTRTAIHRNVSQILQLHEDLLGELHRIVPNSEYTHDDVSSSPRPRKAKHSRWHSVDIVPGRVVGLAVHLRQQRHSLDLEHQEDATPIALTTDTKTVADIARLFEKFLKRFFAYEEYSAQFESVNGELESSHRAIAAWHDYERGIEALSTTLVSDNKKESNGKKGLTLADLLIKPIQRPSKYPLLFADLLKHTPVADDPVAHAELEKTYYRLKDANQEINNAKDDPITRRLIETTWLLQDRLIFPEDQPLPRALLTRLLGHVSLCGILHVTYQTNERTEGKYMICILFNSCLLLALADKSSSGYEVVATITLANGSIEPSDNGRGLQCHTAPFTWKLVFESGHRLYEVILSACSAEEEEVWKTSLRSRVAAENSDLIEGRSSVQDVFSSLLLDLKSIGTTFGPPNNFSRKMSIRRAATLGPKMHPQQVIIKNTQAQKRTDSAQSAASLPVGRSQSQLSASKLVPTFAPRRGERIRLETIISDVWTKDTLPYPGMGPRRGDNPIRASANSVMRKLSMASITSNFSRRSDFSKRSGSYASLSQLRREEAGRSRPRRKSPPSAMRKSVSVPGIKVDFHTAPDAFLPADFELITPLKNSQQRRRGNRAYLSDRSGERIVAPGVLPRAMSLSPSPRPPSFTLRKKLSLPALVERSTVDLPAQVKPAKAKATPERASSLHPPARESTPVASPLRRFIKPRTRLFKFWSTRNETSKAALASSRASTSGSTP
ncbi:rho guanyl nucleotide exchange factor [Diplodia corticola]|uniref:Rho guanyl nucleotide exchange factor n=1 Tax=Diplodia corticola TaxID=236234 RepID=A0A1J9S789_9PEZI|nr:rho guanyl nucleotide exchange factor [Diplodia corticola]OJD35469.1 rho guanyl nucleotide exchange factor [Diplodia corticola]